MTRRLTPRDMTERDVHATVGCLVIVAIIGTLAIIGVAVWAVLQIVPALVEALTR